MLTREQKEWIVEGFCGSFERCGKKCPIRHLCEQVDVNFARFEDDVIDECVKIIAQNVIEDEQMKWISVDEPPEYNKNSNSSLIDYLVVTQYYGVKIGNYLSRFNSWFVNGIPVKVTHWMEIPKLPKED